MGDGSQVIRRKDLLELGTSFRESLSPLKDLVEYMRRQVISVDRLQAWVFVLTGLAAVSLLMTFGAIWYLSVVAGEMARTVEKMEHLEQRVGKVSSTTERAAEAAEAAEKSTKEIVTTQSMSPTLELIAETDPVKARTAPVLLRVSPPRTGSSAEAAPAASVTIPIKR